jgi:hypothetical protein
MPDDDARAEDYARAISKVVAHAAEPAIMARAGDRESPKSLIAIAAEQILALVRRSVRSDRRVTALDSRLAAAEARINQIEADRANARRIILPGDGR